MIPATRPQPIPLDRLSQPSNDDSSDNASVEIRRVDRRLPRPEKTKPQFKSSPLFIDKFLNFLRVAIWIPAGVIVVMIVALVGFGIHFDRVTSGSMAPTFHTGDVLVTSTSHGGDLSVGRVIKVRTPESGLIYTHRVAALNNDGSAVTKGDANNTPDMHQPTNTESVGVLLNIIPQPGAFIIAQIAPSTDWWGSAARAASVRDTATAPELMEGAPWGWFALLVLAVVLLRYPRDHFGYKAQQRAQKEAELDATNQIDTEVDRPFEGEANPELLTTFSVFSTNRSRSGS